MRHFVLVAIAILIAGCTSGNPVTPQQDEALPTLGIINTNILGAYELTIDVDSMAVELMPKRQSAIGESWIINGKSYFETPTDYFTLCGFEFEPDVIVVKFEIKHPYEKGNPNAPPSSRNRLDLDIFDLAMVVVPKPRSPINYPLLNVDIPTYVIDKPDGLTSDFAIPFESNIALPYVLVVDDSKNEPPESTFNRFEMGDSTTFEARFPIILGGSLNFDLYLTFGYGFSAVLADRLRPDYYNPEFNRKAAWKVEVYPPNGNDIPEVGNTWDNIDSSTDYTVTVKVYDWQMGANVNPDLEEKTDVYASSEVDRVSVEIPGMTNEAISVPGDSYLPGGTGMPDSPLIYHIPIRNENKLSYGEYTALVAVYDERSPLDVSAGRDYLIHTSDAGKTMIDYEIPAYVTYQAFKAVVVNYHHTHCNLMWAKRAGGIKNDHVNDITTLSDDSIIITGCIESTANFGEGDPNETVLTVPDDSYATYFARYNLDGMLIWAQFAGEG